MEKLNAEGKMKYLNDTILPKLQEAFERGDKKYTGMQHYASNKIMMKDGPSDINHVRRCHVGVRLLEAEDLAESQEYNNALEKIVSAIGYLIILYIRISERLKNNGTADRS